MSKMIAFEEWHMLSDQDKAAIIQSWNPYEGDGGHILKVVCEEFTKKYGGQPCIIDIASGLYHGGIQVISVTLTGAGEVDLPSHFEGFPVLTLLQ